MTKHDVRVRSHLRIVHTGPRWQFAHRRDWPIKRSRSLQRTIADASTKMEMVGMAVGNGIVIMRTTIKEGFMDCSRCYDQESRTVEIRTRVYAKNKKPVEVQRGMWHQLGHNNSTEVGKKHAALPIQRE